MATRRRQLGSVPHGLCSAWCGMRACCCPGGRNILPYPCSAFQAPHQLLPLPSPPPPTQGFPGSVASLWQQAGRAGRRQQRSLSMVVAFDGPLDQHFVRHPDELFGRPIEAVQVGGLGGSVLLGSPCPATLARCALPTRPMRPSCCECWSGSPMHPSPPAPPARPVQRALAAAAPGVRCGGAPPAAVRGRPAFRRGAAGLCRCRPA